MNAIQALNVFWSKFGLVAYDETAVPSDAQLPYLTYEAVNSDFNRPVVGTASLWYYDTSLADISEKTLQISHELGLGGSVIPYDGGTIWIQKGTPFAQRMADPNDMVKRMVLNLQYEYLGD